MSTYSPPSRVGQLNLITEPALIGSWTPEGCALSNSAASRPAPLRAGRILSSKRIDGLLVVETADPHLTVPETVVRLTDTSFADGEYVVASAVDSYAFVTFSGGSDASSAGGRFTEVEDLPRLRRSIAVEATDADPALTVPVDVAEGAPYRISVKADAPAGTMLNLSVVWLDEAGDSLGEDLVASIPCRPGFWVTAHGVVTSPASSVTAAVSVTLSGLVAEAVALVAEAVVTDATDPTGPFLDEVLAGIPSYFIEADEADEADENRPLLRWLAAASSTAERAVRIARRFAWDPDGTESWQLASELVDPDEAPGPLLPWLGQHIGVRPEGADLNAGTTAWFSLMAEFPTWDDLGTTTWGDAEELDPFPFDEVAVLREQVKEGWTGVNAGTASAIHGAVSGLMTTSATVTVLARTCGVDIEASVREDGILTVATVQDHAFVVGAIVTVESTSEGSCDGVYEVATAGARWFTAESPGTDAVSRGGLATGEAGEGGPWHAVVVTPVASTPGGDVVLRLADMAKPVGVIVSHRYGEGSGTYTATGDDATVNPFRTPSPGFRITIPED